MNRQVNDIKRREFLKCAVQTTAFGAIATNLAVGAIPENKQIKLTDKIPSRVLGKTGVKLPILGYGGAALPKKWGNSLLTKDRVKLVRHAYDSGIRYFDTAISYTYGDSQSLIGKSLQDVRDNVFITTKVDFWDTSKPDGRFTKVPKGEATRQVEMNLKELQSDYIDAVLIHGTPGVEQMTVEQCMEVLAELVKARDKGLVRFVGFSAHSYFDKALALIESDEFDLCMLSIGYIPRGHDQIWSARMTELRNACIAKAHARDMGIVAMKVVGAGILGAWSGYIVPGFDKQRIKQLPAAAIRYVLQDERIDMLTIGMRLEEEIDANIKILLGDTTYTPNDRALLAEYSAKAFESDAIKRMKIE
jgi:predicted aldo/keto reductase-like oxidoreductase